MSDFPQSYLPCTLRLLSKAESLNRARELVTFLQDATEAMATHGVSSERNAFGMFVCFELLSDYLDIARGEYAPFLEVLQNKELFQTAEEKKAVRHE